MWKPIDEGKTIGMVGSEAGIIIRDEEYNASCHMTIEKCERYYAIICGIYGCMVHTTFFNEEQYRKKYDAMKMELQEFIDLGMNNQDEFIDSFTERY